MAVATSIRTEQKPVTPFQTESRWQFGSVKITIADPTLGITVFSLKRQPLKTKKRLSYRQEIFISLLDGAVGA